MPKDLELRKMVPEATNLDTNTFLKTPSKSKGESIRDYFFHNHPEYTTGDTGDVSCDSYHKYQEDVQMLRALKANVYRFLISWARVLPTGDLDVINQGGIDYYNNLINELLANGIQPLVTMYHWDLPQALQYIGGWSNGLLVDYFVEYARTLFENFGDRVKWWIKINAPAGLVNGYAVNEVAPSQPASGIGDYLATHTAIKAHARVWHQYDEQTEPRRTGYLGAVLEAIYTDGVPVIGHLAWSLMDTLEWNAGFTAKYGLYEVDFNSPNRTRTPKDSAVFMAEVLLLITRLIAASNGRQVTRGNWLKM
ncbi:myrosinase 1-like [Schistocerca serialis cubense]|uniref:myrosinase 1-like n=1 Tax=Schistocerca serialis cubense TaxID=2023355 RepID=UPI00214E5E92|nr:myrosinase 1-like [Schistocerca serialis cubense]